MALLTTRDVETYYATDKPRLEYPEDAKALVRPSFESVPFRGKKVRGKVVCDGAAIDALKGYGRCRLVDDKGNELIVAGWVVNLDPTEKEFWEPKLRIYKYPVRYEFCFRADVLDEVSVEIPELKERLEELAEKNPDKYVCVFGAVVNPKVYVAELREVEALGKKIAEMVGL